MSVISDHIKVPQMDKQRLIADDMRFDHNACLRTLYDRGVFVVDVMTSQEGC